MDYSIEHSLKDAGLEEIYFPRGLATMLVRYFYEVTLNHLASADGAFYRKR